MPWRSPHPPSAPAPRAGRRAPAAWPAVLAALLGAVAAGAQYAPSSTAIPGSGAATRPELEKQKDDARWRFGRLLVEPWMGIRDVAYVDTERDVEGTEVPADLTVTVGAGIEAYLPVGEDALWVAFVLPEYAWWQDLEERRRLNGRYGLGLFTDLGRASLGATVSLVDDARSFSRELEEPVNSSSRQADLGLDVPLAAGFSLAALGSLRDIEFDRDDMLPPIAVISREEEVARALLRYEVRSGFTLGLGMQWSDLDFDEEASLRSNRDRGLVVEIAYGIPRFSLAADVVAHDLESDLGPESLDWDRWAGTLRATWRALGRLDLEAIADRRLVYSFQNAWAYFEDSGVELAARLSLGTRASLRLSAGEGRNEYFPFDVAAPNAVRLDDYESVGAALQFRLVRAVVVLGVAETRYDSNLPQADRDVTNLRMSIIFGRRDAAPWGR